ncbi:CAP domain-containing protein [Coemansia spiralis]|nr:CAP domain-containing protein [Coemansia spiralis]
MQLSTIFIYLCFLFTAHSTRLLPNQHHFSSRIDPPSNWREQMLLQVNDVRRKAGILPVSLSEQANIMAQKHSEYQASTNQMTHDDPSGSLGQRATAEGLLWSSLAENIAVGNLNVSTAMGLWINSPHHYANIVGNYSLVGFGVAGTGDISYWTQEFIHFLAV